MAVSACMPATIFDHQPGRLFVERVLLRLSSRILILIVARPQPNLGSALCTVLRRISPAAMDVADQCLVLLA
jgi:hypothetical protein